MSDSIVDHAYGHYPSYCVALVAGHVSSSVRANHASLL